MVTGTGTVVAAVVGSVESGIVAVGIGVVVIVIVDVTGTFWV